MRANRSSQESAERQHVPIEPDATNSAASRANDDQEPLDSPEPDVLQLLLRQFRELGEYFSYYLTAKSDSFKLSLRNAVLRTVLVALGFVAIVAVIFTASWLLLIGLAGGLGALCGDRPWVGNALTGVLVFTGFGLATYFTLAKRARSYRERMVEKYEQRRSRQHANFGRDVADQAAATAEPKR